MGTDGNGNGSIMRAAVAFDPDGVPEALKREARFCAWRYVEKDGKATKRPLDPRTGSWASVSKPGTFAPWAEAAMGYADALIGGRRRAYDGMGVLLPEGLGAVDIDHCVREDGSLSDLALDVMSDLPGAYFELSPSGRGLRGFFRVGGEDWYDPKTYMMNNQKEGLEVYIGGATNRFVTVTGRAFRDGDVVEDRAGLLAVLEKHMRRSGVPYGAAANPRLVDPHSYLDDEGVLGLAGTEAEFGRLWRGEWEGDWESHSDADMALASRLAYWCGCDEVQMDRLFRRSGLMRPKWDERRGACTYGELTLRRAAETTGQTYVPSPDAEEDFLGGPGEVAAADAADGPEGAPDAGSGGGLYAVPCSTFRERTFGELRPESDARYGGDEKGMGRLFADLYAGRLLYDKDRGVWMLYDGTAWAEDKGGLDVMSLAMAFSDGLSAYVNGLPDSDRKKNLAIRAGKLCRRAARTTMIADASAVCGVPNASFDAAPYLFNCQNGTLDLRTMEFRGHDPRDMLTKRSPAAYDPQAGPGRWGSFIREVLPDPEVEGFFQKAAGYALSGVVKEECFFVLFGPTTRNGKTTTLGALVDVFGDYARTADADMLTMRGAVGVTREGPSESVARLKGARFIGFSELQQNLKLDAARVKQFTGNSPITARNPYERSFEFRMTGKMFLDTNYLPEVTDQTLFDSGRVKVVPFTRHFQPEEQDPGLRATLAEPGEMAAILNWCVEGWRAYVTEGLGAPEVVSEQVAEYQVESDQIVQFMAQRLKHEEGSEVLRPAAYRAYQDWCAENGFKAKSRQKFTKALIKEYVLEKRWNKAHTERGVYLDDCAFTDEEDEFDLVP